jgi:predicted RNase H-like HicB family nuclease
MELSFETNGKAFLGWIDELPGAYIRGKTIAEAKEKLDDEIAAYQAWLGLSLEHETISNECILQSRAVVEEADTEVLLNYDTNDYENAAAFGIDCEKILRSAEQFNRLYKNCNHKNIVDKMWVGKTFWGDLPSTIEKQLGHILDTQRWYVNNIEGDIDFESSIVAGRKKILKVIVEKHESEGNRIYNRDQEDWTLRKVIRRLIWHDRFHARAMEEMEKRLEEEFNSFKNG